MRNTLIAIGLLSALLLLPTSASAAPAPGPIAGPCTPGDGNICIVCNDDWSQCWGVYDPEPHAGKCPNGGFTVTVWGTGLHCR